MVSECHWIELGSKVIFGLNALKKIKVGNKTDYVLRPDYIKEFQLLEN